MPSSAEEVMPMRRSVLATFVALVLASPAYADVWEFSWTSDVQGIRFLSVASGVSDSSTSSHMSGTSSATITPGGSGGLNIAFATPAGPAALNVTPPDRVGGTVPAFIPPAPSGTVVGSLPGTSGWFLGNAGASGTYTWIGEFTHPESFQVTTVAPGSGPAPEVAFAGMGRLVQSSSAPVTQATEPELAVLCVGLLSATLVARLRRA
jgi:hypothetical protein